MKLIYDPSDLGQQEGPGVDQVDPVHHDDDDTVPALEPPGETVLDEERVTEDKPVLLIPKEDGTFPARADLDDGNTPRNIQRGAEQHTKKMRFTNK